MKRIAYIFLLLFVLSDIVFSTVQHVHMPLDGDLANIVAPSQDYQKVLEDPFGFQVVLNDSVYPAPNRFFAHWFQQQYFRTAPLVLQHFSTPVESVYLASGFAKSIIQYGLIFLMAIGVSRHRNPFHKDFLLACALLIPLFQTFGYNGYMGIIDHSISYSFFYAFSCGILLWFFLPFFNSWFYKQDYGKHFLQLLFSVLLAVILVFHGPLNPAVVLIVCPATMLLLFWKNLKQMADRSALERIKLAFHNMPKKTLSIFILVSILALYSLYIGRNNIENLWTEVPLWDRYKKLPLGLWNQFTQKLGLPLLLIMVAINRIIVRTQNIHKQKLVKLLHWILVLSAIYILLLPLGGYRSYRPNIIRRDTIMPIILALIFFYGLSSFYILKQIQMRKKGYYLGTISFLLIFTFADLSIKKKNLCEKQALERIAASSAKTIILEEDCNVMSWEKLERFENSELNMVLLKHWGIVRSEKRYRHQ